MAKPLACLVMRDDVAAWLWVECKVIGCAESFVSVVVSVVVVDREDVISSV
jgi:hypothetical protein